MHGMVSLDLLKVCAWQPLHFLRHSATRDDDPLRTLDGPGHGRQWYPVEDCMLPLPFDVAEWIDDTIYVPGREARRQRAARPSHLEVGLLQGVQIFRIWIASRLGVPRQCSHVRRRWTGSTESFASTEPVRPLPSEGTLGLLPRSAASGGCFGA